jgi:hypothetical protein
MRRRVPRPSSGMRINPGATRRSTLENPDSFNMDLLDMPEIDE